MAKKTKESGSEPRAGEGLPSIRPKRLAPHLELEIREEEERVRLHWRSVVANPVGHGFRSAAEAEEAARLDLSQPSTEELDEFADAHELFGELERTDEAAARAGALRPVTVSDHAAMKLVREEAKALQQASVAIRKKLQSLNPKPLNGKSNEFSSAVESVERSRRLMASTTELIDAFGAHTGMARAWFRTLRDTPALFDAVLVPGVGGRPSVEPLFCPMKVMTWLANPKRRKGRPFHSEQTPWELLRKHFPEVYAANSPGSPLED